MALALNQGRVYGVPGEDMLESAPSAVASRQILEWVAEDRYLEEWKFDRCLEVHIRRWHSQKSLESTHSPAVCVPTHSNTQSIRAV